MCIFSQGLRESTSTWLKTASIRLLQLFQRPSCMSSIKITTNVSKRAPRVNQRYIPWKVTDTQSDLAEMHLAYPTTKQAPRRWLVSPRPQRLALNFKLRIGWTISLRADHKLESTHFYLTLTIDLSSIVKHEPADWGEQAPKWSADSEETLATQTWCLRGGKESALTDWHTKHF
jgi:hypothetical protein